MIKVLEYGPWTVWKMKQGHFKALNDRGGWMKFQAKPDEDLEQIIRDVISCYLDLPYHSRDERMY